jgi:hypothetical protein
MRRLHLLLLVSVLTVGSLGAPAEASAARPTVAWSTAAITNGPCLPPSPSYCAFLRTYVTGTFSVTGFRVEGTQLLADGLASGSFFHTIVGRTAFSGVPVTLPVSEIAATCETAVLTLRGSDPPDPANGVWEPLPEVLTFSHPSPAGDLTISVGLLPTTLTASSSSSVGLCRLATAVKSGNANAIAQVLNSLLR